MSIQTQCSSLTVVYKPHRRRITADNKSWGQHGHDGVIMDCIVLLSHSLTMRDKDAVEKSSLFRIGEIAGRTFGLAGRY